MELTELLLQVCSQEVLQDFQLLGAQEVVLLALRQSV